MQCQYMLKNTSRISNTNFFIYFIFKNICHIIKLKNLLDGKVIFGLKITKTNTHMQNSWIKSNYIFTGSSDKTLFG